MGSKLAGTPNFGVVMEHTQWPHVPTSKAHLFLSRDRDYATEYEYLGVIGALVRATKPARILETGTWTGAGTAVLAAAADANGIGEVTAVEMDAAILSELHAKLKEAFPSVPVFPVNKNSLEFLVEDGLQPFQFAFLDTETNIRAKELGILLDRGLLEPGGIACIHDTSRNVLKNDMTTDDGKIEFWREFSNVTKRHPGLRTIELPYSRGLLIVQNWYPQ